MDNLVIFRKNLLYFRKKHGYNQTFIADILHKKSYTTVQKWECGKAEPPFGDVILLCRLYNVSVDDMLKVDFEKRDNK